MFGSSDAAVAEAGVRLCPPKQDIPLPGVPKHTLTESHNF